VKDLQVWLEEAKTGRIVAGTVADASGAWSLEGLPAGKYRAFAQSRPDPGEAKIKKLYSALPLGEAVIVQGKSLAFEKPFSARPRKLTLDYLGFNSQLSSLAVPVNGGKQYSLYIADKSLPNADFKLSFNSTNIKFVHGSIRANEFNSGLKAFVFDVTVAENTLPGEYSLRVQSRDGDVLYLVGALTVDSQVNNIWTSTFSLLNQ
jgi:hypothetical protein